MATKIRHFVEKGSPVNAIQHDGTQETADEIVEMVKAPLRAEAVPKGQFNQDFDNVYVGVQSFYSIQYVGPGDWCFQKIDGKIGIMSNLDFRREHIALDNL